jgi:hypothetical protein
MVVEREAYWQHVFRIMRLCYPKGWHARKTALDYLQLKQFPDWS